MPPLASSPYAAGQPLGTSFSGASTAGTLRQQAEELEGIFLNTLMSQMFSSIDTDSAFGGGYAEETWRSMQSEQYAAMLAEAGGIGLADHVMRDLLAVQEAAIHDRAFSSEVDAGSREETDRTSTRSMSR